MTDKQRIIAAHCIEQLALAMSVDKEQIVEALINNELFHYDDDLGFVCKSIEEKE